MKVRKIPIVAIYCEFIANLLRHLDSNSPEQAKTDVNMIPDKIERVKEKVVAVILKYVE